MTLTGILAARRWWELENQREATTIYLSPADSDGVSEQVRALYLGAASVASAEATGLMWKIDEGLAPSEIRFAEERT